MQGTPFWLRGRLALFISIILIEFTTLLYPELKKKVSGKVKVYSRNIRKLDIDIAF
jgi:hypothetical protein